MNWLRNRIAEWQIVLERWKRRRAMKRARENPAQVIDYLPPDFGKTLSREDVARMQ